MSEKQAVKRGMILAAFVFVVFASALGIVFWANEQFQNRADEVAVLAKETARISVRTDYLLCVEAKKNREAIRAAILSSDPTKLQPGDYGYDYARTHPLEAAVQHDKIVSGTVGALALFPPITCPPDPDKEAP